MSRRAIGAGGASVNDPADAVHRPDVYQSLLDWQRDEYARGRYVDPRWKVHHRGEEPPPEVRLPHPLLDALEAGEPVVVSTWDASGRRWTGNGWSEPVFELPWDVPGFQAAGRRGVPHAKVSQDDSVRPVSG